MIGTVWWRLTNASANRNSAWRVLADESGNDRPGSGRERSTNRRRCEPRRRRRPGSREMADKSASAVIVESPQNSTGRLSEEAIVDVARAVAVTFRGLGDRHQATQLYGTRTAAMTKFDLAKNHQRLQRPFGHVVGGWHLRIIHKHEPLMLMFQNLLLQSHSFFMAHRKGDQLLQAFSQPDLLVLREMMCVSVLGFKIGCVALSEIRPAVDRNAVAEISRWSAKRHHWNVRKVVFAPGQGCQNPWCLAALQDANSLRHEPVVRRSATTG